MSIPASVRAQAEKAQQIASDIAKAKAGEGAAQDDQDTAEQAALDAEDTAAKAEQDAKAAAEASQAAKDQGDKSGPDDQTWEQKYRTLQAKYDKEVPRLMRESHQLRTQVDGLLAEVEALKGKPAQGNANQDTDKPSKLDPGLLDDYGPEFRVLVEQISALTEENEKLRTRVEQTDQRVEKTAETTQKSAREAAWNQFSADLAAAVDGFAQLNVDPEFLDWLEMDDELSGEPRKAALNRAVQAMDVGRTAKVFHAFLKQSGRNTGNQDAGQQSKPKDEVMRQVQPSRRTADGGSQPQKKVYSPADISKFYDDKRRGKYKGREAEADRIQKEIFAQLRGD